MSNLIILIGLPGSGKTTLAKKIESRGYVRLCADDLRECLWGDASDQSHGGWIFFILERGLATLLSEGKNVVWDNTSLNQKARKKVTEIAHDHGCNVTMVYMDTSLEQCIHRQQFRERKVPEDVIRSMNDRMTVPFGAVKASELDLETI